MLQAVKCIYVPVTDVFKSGEWYRDVLGLKLRRIDPDGIAFMSLVDGTDLLLIKTQDRQTLNFTNLDGSEGFALNFLVKDIEVFHQKLSDDGVNVQPLRDQGGCGMQFVIYDPDGNMYQVQEDQLVLWMGWPKDSLSVQKELANQFFLNSSDQTWESFEEQVNVALMPRRVVVNGWNVLQDRLPHDAQKLKKFLDRIVSDFPERDWRIEYRTRNILLLDGYKSKKNV
jgi:catechol 2,3-dioxygenase-like lactoylglutathione lyase family enzyme